MNSQHQMPPVPGGSGQSFGARYGNKIALICAISVVLMICAGIIWGFAYDRENDSERVSRDIAQEWGEDVVISNVAFLLPDTSAGKSATLDSVLCAAEIKSELLHRNIYQAEVYKADVAISGSIGASVVRADSIPREARFIVGLDPKSIVETGELVVAGRKFELERTTDGLTASVPLDLVVAGSDFQASFKVRGSKGFYFNPPVGKNELIISGNSSSPSFKGSSLPVDRTVSDEGFTAKWVNIAPADPDRQDTIGYTEEITVYPADCHGDGGVDFVIGIDTYRKVVRAIKYAFLIILLTFITVFATEVISRRNIPLLNYFLIGAALVVFYLLLLSIAELWSFGYAYLISTAMTVGLICVYLRTMLHSRRLALYNASFLTILYGCCYVMLCVSVYALLVGSLMLFLALALAMNISLRLQKINAR